MRGRKPKPTAVKKREGNNGGRKLNRKEPKTVQGSFVPPAWLTGRALAEWKRIVPILKSMGTFSDSDRTALEIYCKAYQRWRQAEEAIDKTGLVMRSPSGYIQQAPHVGLARKYADQVARLAAEFGLTPSSRSRINVEQADAADDADFFGKNIKPTVGNGDSDKAQVH